MARPKKQIDGALVEKMASWGCKTVEIAEHFSCSDQTITANYLAELTKGRTALKTNLRQWQLRRAQAGSDTMLIWLGKQLLGQSDKLESKVETSTAGDAELKRLRDLVKARINERK